MLASGGEWPHAREHGWASRQALQHGHRLFDMKYISSRSLQAFRLFAAHAKPQGGASRTCRLHAGVAQTQTQGQLAASPAPDAAHTARTRTVTCA